MGMPIVLSLIPATSGNRFRKLKQEVQEHIKNITYTTAVAQLVNAPLSYVGGPWIKAELCQSFPRPPPTQEMAVNWVVLAFTREFR